MHGRVFGVEATDAVKILPAMRHDGEIEIIRQIWSVGCTSAAVLRLSYGVSLRLNDVCF